MTKIKTANGVKVWVYTLLIEWMIRIWAVNWSSDSCVVNLQWFSSRIFRIRWKCSQCVGAVCCMYRDECVWMQSACLLWFFFSPSLSSVQTRGVIGFFLHAEDVCRCAFKIRNDRNIAWWRHRRASKWMFKYKTRERRKEGRVWELGRCIHALWRVGRARGLHPSFESFRSL